MCISIWQIKVKINEEKLGGVDIYLFVWRLVDLKNKIKFC